MLSAAASLLNVKVVILDSGDHAPAKQVVAPTAAHLAHVDGSFADAEKIQELAKKVDVLTMEIEHVDVESLRQIESSTNLEIHPSPSTIHIIQDKYRQKEHLSTHKLPLGDFLGVEPTVASVQGAVDKLGLPLMLKSRTLAYDGRGNFAIRDASQIPEAISTLGERPLYAEKWVPFTKEIAVMVVRSASGEVLSYPVVETVHKENICHLVFAPLRSRDPTLSDRARKIAEDAVKTFSGAGVFGVEMFLTENSESHRSLNGRR
jgi:phosphoribosylaminoimidazole carboxylase